MKSALLVGPQANLFALVAERLLVLDDAVVVGELAQVDRGGALALFYEYPGDDWRDPPVPGLDASALTAVMVESRSEVLVADLFRHLATGVSGIRLVDSADAVWDLDSIDGASLTL